MELSLYRVLKYHTKTFKEDHGRYQPLLRQFQQFLNQEIAMAPFKMPQQFQNFREKSIL